MIEQPKTLTEVCAQCATPLRRNFLREVMCTNEGCELCWQVVREDPPREQFPPLAPQEPEPETPPAWLGAAFVAMAVFAVIGAAFVGVQIGRAVMIYLTGGAP